MLPSCTRSSSCKPRLVCFLASETTRRRFALISSAFARSAWRLPLWSARSASLERASCRASSRRRLTMRSTTGGRRGALRARRRPSSALFHLRLVGLGGASREPCEHLGALGGAGEDLGDADRAGRILGFLVVEVADQIADADLALLDALGQLGELLGGHHACHHGLEHGALASSTRIASSTSPSRVSSWTLDMWRKVDVHRFQRLRAGAGRRGSRRREGREGRAWAADCFFTFVSPALPCGALAEQQHFPRKSCDRVHGPSFLGERRVPMNRVKSDAQQSLGGLSKLEVRRRRDARSFLERAHFLENVSHFWGSRGGETRAAHTLPAYGSRSCATDGGAERFPRHVLFSSRAQGSWNRHSRWRDARSRCKNSARSTSRHPSEARWGFCTCTSRKSNPCLRSR